MLENIDPQDWAKPGADIILQRIKQQRRDGSIILLHDAGGDRSQTVEALPRILDWLHTRGDTVVSLSTLLGTTRDAVMPPLQANHQSLTRFVSSTGFRIYHAHRRISLGVHDRGDGAGGRSHADRHLAGLSFPACAAKSDFAEPISVVIAAYNEEKVIAETLRTLLATDYKGEIEVIVVDDGSRDETAAEVERVAQSEAASSSVAPGKSRESARSAARSGRGASWHRRFHRRRHALPARYASAVARAVRGCAESARFPVTRRLGICGRSSPGVRRSNTPAVSISIGAPTIAGTASPLCRARSARFAKTQSIEAGGLSLETLAEDTDLTLALHRHRQRIVYVPGAIAWTEAPETVRTLARQRFRWAYGTLQCLWKHRDMVFNWNYRALGWFSLPSVWFFQIILVAVTPMVDLFLLASLPFGAWRAVLPFVIIFLAMDVILATLACMLEREPLVRAWRILPMRLIYRPMLSYCIWKAILRAIKGAWVSWGKLERTASVPVRA